MNSRQDIGMTGFNSQILEVTMLLEFMEPVWSKDLTKRMDLKVVDSVLGLVNITFFTEKSPHQVQPLKITLQHMLSPGRAKKGGHRVPSLQRYLSIVTWAKTAKKKGIMVFRIQHLLPSLIHHNVSNTFSILHHHCHYGVILLYFLLLLSSSSSCKS
jgi:hypothetical protein